MRITRSRYWSYKLFTLGKIKNKIPSNIEHQWCTPWHSAHQFYKLQTYWRNWNKYIFVQYQNMFPTLTLESLIINIVILHSKVLEHLPSHIISHYHPMTPKKTTLRCMQWKSWDIKSWNAKNRTTDKPRKG